MKKYILISLFFTILSFSSFGQEKKEPEVEIWYVWIDTEIKKDDKNYRLISKTPFQISCCVKSPKYRKLSKKAQKWVMKNYDQSYNGESVFNKVQDKALAADMIKKVINDGPASDILVIEYIEECD